MTTTLPGNGEAVGLWKLLGTDSQAALSELHSNYTDWTTSHRLRGLAYVVLRFRYGSPTEALFQGGQPQEIRFLVQGAKAYDSRLDSTNGGSGSHRYADPTTWEYTANPILCAAHYEMVYRGIDGSRFNWTVLAAQADICDEQVPIPPAASPENTEARFECHGELSLGSTHRENIQAILGACEGERVRVNGKIEYYAAAYRSPTISIVENDLAGDVVVRTAYRFKERFNALRGTFFDAANEYREMQFPPWTNASFETRDGGTRIYKDVGMPMVSSVYQCQRLGKIKVQRSDQQHLVTVPLNLTGLRLAPGRTWSAHAF